MGALEDLASDAHALILYSTLGAGFSAGADLRELYGRAETLGKALAVRGVRDFLERMHAVLKYDGRPFRPLEIIEPIERLARLHVPVEVKR